MATLTSKAEYFIKDLNNIHPTIKFTHEKSAHNITFLLTKVPVSPGVTKIISTTHFNQFLHYNSFHPTATKLGTLKGEITRIKKTTTDKEKTEDLITFIKSKFKARGYLETENETNRCPETNIANKVYHCQPSAPKYA